MYICGIGGGGGWGSNIGDPKFHLSIGVKADLKKKSSVLFEKIYAHNIFWHFCIGVVTE